MFKTKVTITRPFRFPFLFNRWRSVTKPAVLYIVVTEFVPNVFNLLTKVTDKTLATSNIMRKLSS